MDFLFIEDVHTYEGGARGGRDVCRDFELCSPLVRGCGMIALHDIAPGDAPEEAVAEAETWSDMGGDMPRFWEELEGRRARGLSATRRPDCSGSASCSSIDPLRRPGWPPVDS